MKKNHRKQVNQYWYAVDKNGEHYFYIEKPIRDEENEYWASEQDYYEIGEMFENNLPELTWEDEPVLLKFVTNIYW